MFYSAQMSTSAAGVVGTVGLDDVVLDKRAGGPAVKSNQTIATSIDGSRVVDGAAKGSEGVLAAMRGVQTHRAAPVCHPIPATTSVLALVHLRLYVPVPRVKVSAPFST